MDSEKDVSMENFALIRVLGKGAYGKVFLVRKIGGPDNGQLYAMKVLKKERVIHKQKTLEHTLAERQVLERLRGLPFLVNMVYAFQSNSKLHIVMEFVRGGELFTHLCKKKFFEVAAARVILAEMVVALDHIHKNNVIYRDLKLENILLDTEGHVKLTDFGLSKAVHDEQNPATSYCGTVEYLAPEVVKRGPNGYKETVDWWSFGVIAFELLTGCSPFTVEGDQNSSQDIARRILTKKVPFPRSMDDTSRSFISALLEKDASRRLGAGGADEIKQHAFFAGINWDDVTARKLQPPIQPVISGNIDVNNFAPEFTNQVPIFSPVEGPADHHGLFRGYSFISPSVIFANDNVIGEECLEENIKLLAKDSSFFAKYEMDATPEGFLGRGTFSVCRKCRRISDGTEFAVKIVSKKFSHHALREIRILELVSPHENVVRMEEAMSDQLHYYVVLELLQGGELLQRLRRMNTFTECQAASIMAQLVAAVSHLHSKSVVHRDLKPENILFESDSPNAKLRLVDFGFARLLPNSLEALNTPCYTLAFAAPEVLEMEDELPQYNQQCDLWSLGVILFTMLSGKVPFHAKSTTESANEIIARIRQAEFSFEDRVWDYVSDTAKDLINGLLTVDPKKRLSLAQLARHPWLRGTETSARELQTPTVLPSTAGMWLHQNETFNETINAFISANRDGFHLMDVDTAPLLVKRRGMKRRMETTASHNENKPENGRKVSGLSPVPELSESTSRRPTTLPIGETNERTPSAPNSAAFTEYRDTKPPYLKYSRDVEADGEARRNS